MATPDFDVIEAKLVEVVQGTADDMGISLKIDAGSIPGLMGLSSHALVAAMCRVEVALDVEIPVKCYIFLDNSLRQLTIREASEKLFKILNKTK
jgi:hypothetical protein